MKSPILTLILISLSIYSHKDEKGIEVVPVQHLTIIISIDLTNGVTQAENHAKASEGDDIFRPELTTDRSAKTAFDNIEAALDNPVRQISTTE
jgi:hypothetical protein